MIRRVVTFSGGVGSWTAAKRVAAETMRTPPIAALSADLHGKGVRRSRRGGHVGGVFRRVPVFHRVMMDHPISIAAGWPKKWWVCLSLTRFLGQNKTIVLDGVVIKARECRRCGTPVLVERDVETCPLCLKRSTFDR